MYHEYINPNIIQTKELRSLDLTTLPSKPPSRIAPLIPVQAHFLVKKYTDLLRATSVRVPKFYSNQMQTSPFFFPFHFLTP